MVKIIASRTIKNAGNLFVAKNLTLFAGNLDLQGILEAYRRGVFHPTSY